MTNLVETETVRISKELCTLNQHIDSVKWYYNHRQRRHVLKSKENSKHKCHKFLRRKLKKYKLRPDGTEDQDVIDVSNFFLSSLVIKSQSNEQESILDGDTSYFEELRPRNYLFKMVHKKESTKLNDNMKILSESIKQGETVNVNVGIVSDEKKHTNAFQLLMDSRNKSIGTNSPGKEQNHNQSDAEEMLKKKSSKVKRTLLLQKMAEAKGYQKNKEMEEIQDKFIKNKMKKRAERLKTMILKETKQPKSIANVDNSDAGETNASKLNKNNKLDHTKNNAIRRQSKRFKIVDIFNTLNDSVCENLERKKVPKEDKEFMNKLSPSLKKTDSVLSYFQKVDKELEPDSIDMDSDKIFRVKLKQKPKKRASKKQQSLKEKMDLHENVEINNENNEINRCDSNKILVQLENLDNCKVKNTSKGQKRKRSSEGSKMNTFDSRPKRSIRKPVKYIDEVPLSSSDDDLHIFTPKKKKSLDIASNNKLTLTNISKEVNEPIKSGNNIKKAKNLSISKKAMKLAPIFGTKQLDSVALEAKQKFLQSGVPDKLKKIINHQNNMSKVSSNFSTVVHVQQSNAVVKVQYKPLIYTFQSDNDDTYSFESEGKAFNKLLNLNEVKYPKCVYNIKDTKRILQIIKQLHPKFPVYRTYSHLRCKSKGEFKDYKSEFDNSIEVMNDMHDVTDDSPDKLTWTDKYRAMSTSQIIGNFESVRELKKWLVAWSENKYTSKNRDNCNSDFSDFYHSDTDSRENFNTMQNLLILTGPTGSGKTSSVYAIAAELSIKVIEVNASSKRTGKIMLQDLQEATQSHKVNRATSSENSQKSQERNLTELLKKKKKRGCTKKSIDKKEELSSTPSSQESTRTDMSLILIDDADIVFDQDDGFSSAIVQLVHCSKRPVILIASSLASPHLQKFLQNGKILKMCHLSPQLLGTWLDIMCLADHGVSWPGAGAKFLDYFKGDMRKTINFLQFYISSYTGINSDEERTSQTVDSYKTNIDDENSSMSWAEHEDVELKQLTPVHKMADMERNSMWTDFVNNNSDIAQYRYPINLFNVWWSLPHFLSTVSVSNSVGKLKNETREKYKETKALEAIADAIDAISLSDYTMGSHSHSGLDMTSQPWYSSDSDSVSEQDNIDCYMNKYEVGDEISHEIVSGYIIAAQNILNCEKKKKLCFPGMTVQRKKDKIATRHMGLTSFLNPWAILDRRSLTLDYWSLCRAICRLEKTKSSDSVNAKRKNRFCHYLKSLNILCTNDMFTNLCDSLSNQGNQSNMIDISDI